MEFEFKLTREEYFDFAKLAFGRMSRISGLKKKMTAFNVLAWVFIGMGFTGIIRFYEEHEYIEFEHLNFALWLFGISAVIMVIASTYQRKQHMQHSLSENGHMLKHQKMSFSNSGVKLATADVVQDYTWEAIHAVEQSKLLVCLYIDNAHAILLPKRIISNESELNEVVAYVESSIGSNKGV